MTRFFSAQALSIVGLLGLTACNGAVDPGTLGTTVQIYQSGVEYEEQVIAPGELLALTARVLGPNGKPLENQPAIDWRSDAPAAATVDGSGNVTGVAPGSARIIAEHSSYSDTALVRVVLPLAGTLSCDGVAPAALDLGETHLAEVTGGTPVCLEGGDSGASYQLSVINTGLAAGARLDTRIAASGLLGGDGPSGQLMSARRTVPGADEKFHYRLRHEISAELEGRLRHGITPAAFPSSTLNAAPGDLIDFNVESTSGDGCSAPVIRTGRVQAETRRAIIVADTLNPAGGYTLQEYEEFARFFEESVWPLVTQTFGTPSDIDSNGQVYILFTRGVNERPENQGSTGVTVGGFFFNRDLFPKKASDPDDNCPGSNEKEMFYLLVPDPDGEAGRPFSKTAVERSNRSVLVHEFQHLVNDSRRLHVNKASSWEETWLNEGLSHIAEELMFYDVTGLAPEANLGPAIFASALNREAFDRYQIDNVNRLASFLRTPASQSLAGSDVLATRGAAWHFLRYIADQSSNEASLWKALVTDAKGAGFDNLRDATGADPRDLLRLWGGALSLDDTAGQTAEYRFPSWDLREIYPALDSYWPSSYYEYYPLRVESLEIDRQYTLRGGSAAYLSAEVAPDATAAVRVSVGDLPPPSRLKVLVTRFR